MKSSVDSSVLNSRSIASAEISVVEGWLASIATYAMEHKKIDSKGFMLGNMAPKSALEISGLSRDILERHFNMPRDVIDQIYRGLFVYSFGMYSSLNEIARHCIRAPILIKKFWQGYLRMVETVDVKSYNLATDCLLKENDLLRVTLDKEISTRLNSLLTSTNDLSTEVMSLENAVRHHSAQARELILTEESMQRKLDDIALMIVLKSDEQRNSTVELEEWRNSANEKSNELRLLENRILSMEHELRISEGLLEDLEIQDISNTQRLADLSKKQEATRKRLIEAEVARNKALVELTTHHNLLKMEQTSKNTYTLMIKAEKDIHDSIEREILTNIQNAEVTENERAEIVAKNLVLTKKITELKHSRNKLLGDLEFAARNKRQAERRRDNAKSQLDQLIRTQV